jgi:EmrB/QacA subfamily drug resistance transporter
MELPAVTVRPQRQGLLFVVLGMSFLVVMMDNSILNVALATIQQDLGASNAQLQWSLDSYILVGASLMIPAGFLADRWGRRRTLVTALIIFGAASALSAFASSPEELILWRAVTGVGGAAVSPVALAIIRTSVARESQAKAMGVWAAIGGVAVALGPIISGALLERFWWGSVFLINVPVTVVCGVLLFVLVGETRSPTPFRLDLPGLLLSVAAVAAVVYGVIRAGEDGDWLALGSTGMIGLGLALGVLLVVVESRTPDPVLNVGLFRDRAFASGSIGLLLAFLGINGTFYLLVFYLQLVRDHSPLEVGLLLLPAAVGSVAGAMGNAGLTRRFGPRLTLGAGLTILGTGLSFVALATSGTPLWLLGIALLLGGIGMGLAMTSATTLAMPVADAGGARAGVDGAVPNIMRQLGSAFGVAVLGSVLSAVYRNGAGDVLAALPSGARTEAGNSLGATLTALHETGTATPALAAGAADAFLHGMHLAAAVGVGVALLGAVLVFRLSAPRR